MKIKFLEQWRFRLAGRAVPVVKCEDIDVTGRIYTLHILGKVKDRANSLLSTWDAKAWEKNPGFGKITMIDDKGIESYPYVVNASGQTCGLYTEPQAFPNREDILGHWSMMDDIADSMDLGKSIRNFVIGCVVGMMLYAFLLGPAIGVMFK